MQLLLHVQIEVQVMIQKVLVPPLHHQGPTFINTNLVDLTKDLHRLSTL